MLRTQSNGAWTCSIKRVSGGSCASDKIMKLPFSQPGDGFLGEFEFLAVFPGFHDYTV